MFPEEVLLKDRRGDGVYLALQVRKEEVIKRLDEVGAVRGEVDLIAISF